MILGRVGWPAPTLLSPHRKKRMRAVRLSKTFGLATFAIFALGAFAPARSAPDARFHTKLLKSSPAAHDTVAVSPAAVKLWFSEKIELPVSSVKLTGPKGAKITLGELTVADSAGSPVVATITKPLADGAYKVSWKAASKDGHPATGTVNFTVRTKH